MPSLISAIAEVEFYMWLRSILNLVLLVALWRDRPGNPGVRTKAINVLVPNFPEWPGQGLTVEVEWTDRGASPPLVAHRHAVCSQEKSEGFRAGAHLSSSSKRLRSMILVKLDAVWPFTLRRLFILDLLIDVIISIFIIANTLLSPFTRIILVRQ